MEVKKQNKGIYHWVILVCCILTLMLAYSTRFGLAQLFTTQVIKKTGSVTSVYFFSTTVASIIRVFTGPIAGKLLRDRYMRPTFVVCVIGTMGFYSCYGFCYELWRFYLVDALQGFFAMGACTVPVTVLITNWFEKNCGLMISIAMMGISLGGTFLSPFLSWTIGMFGWRRAYFILGAVSLCALIPISAFIVRRSPEDVGLFPCGHGEESSGKHGKNKNVSADSWNATLSEARKTPILWMFAADGFLTYFTSCIMGHMGYYLQTTGFAPSSITAYISAYPIVALTGKLVLGHMFDRFGPKGGILLGCGTFFIFLICFIMVQGDPLMLYLSAVLYGFGTCTTTVAIPIMTTSIFSLKNYSEIYGFISASTMTGGAIGSSGIGLAYDITGSYKPALTILALLTILTIVIMFICISLSQKHIEELADKCVQMPA